MVRLTSLLNTKTVVVGASMAALTLGMAGSALASTATISNTGPRSTNTISYNMSSGGGSWHHSIRHNRPARGLNWVRHNNQTNSVVTNNSVGVSSSSSQNSSTGNAAVSGNTTGGNATSGPASNSNTTDTMVDIDNSGVGALLPAPMPLVDPLSGSITNTGPGSTNTISLSDSSSSTMVMTNNSVQVSNSSSQTAKSGKAKVNGNTTGGNAVSGSAMNTNSTTSTVGISN